MQNMERPSSVLFTPFDLGRSQLRNRIVMAPLTRDRATPGTDAPNALNAEYYRQRASAGLIIAEATQISPYGKGYAFTPGIYSPEQIAGWRSVTDAVHAEGGTIYLQLWHVGRFSHPSLQPGGLLPVAPSAIAPRDARTFLENGDFAEVGTPRALELVELPGLIDDYADATTKAIAAGFDGVEIHAANGYLLDQFMRDGSNLRTDRYGGSVANRIRLTIEVTEAVVGAAGADRTGIRISPVSPAGAVFDSDPQSVFFPLVRELNRFGLAYCHVVEGHTQGPREFHGFDFVKLRESFEGPWMVNNGYTREMAAEAVESGLADLVAFGRAYIANPDLVERLRIGAPLNDVDWDHTFGGDERGYTDYRPLHTADVR
ncbi:MAG: alkene reductase [Candidatus Eremiobacteraeota bacterium]|nr:alkene reductase [Candidatus Eremiobacteraeota bacterium]